MGAIYRKPEYKKATHAKLIEMYQKRGAAYTVKMAEGLLHSQEYYDDFEFRMEVHGEICETVLEIVLDSYLKKNCSKDKWILVKNLVLFERGRKPGDFLTEIDLALFLEPCVFLFECKSYAGEKVLCGDGVLKRQNASGYDIYRQSCLHRRTLEPWLEGFVNKGKIPLIQMCMFNFSNGGITDTRSRSAKLELPCLGVGDVAKYVTGFHDSVWDMQALKLAVPKLVKISEKLHDRHLEYVKNLHGRRV